MLEKLKKNLEQIDTKDLKKSEEAMYAEDEKEGTRATKEHHEEKERVDGIGKNMIEESLGKKRKYTKLEYKKYLAQIFMCCLRDLEWPLGYQWRVLVTRKGIAVAFTDNHKLLYSKGIAETGEIKMDVNAINMLVMKTENTIERIIKDEQRTTRGSNNSGGANFKGVGGQEIPQKPI